MSNELCLKYSMFPKCHVRAVNIEKEVWWWWWRPTRKCHASLTLVITLPNVINYRLMQPDITDKVSKKVIPAQTETH